METSLKCVWFTATRTIGTRRLGRWASSMGPYRDTVFSFPDVKGYVALTIDDGLCRNAGCSLAKEVLELLQKHDARATFFICSDYLSGCEEEAFALLGAGHEFANHLTADRVNYYHKLKPEKLQAELRKASEAIHALNGQVKWFRAPQGRMTNSMKTLVAEEGMRHAIGDAYCDDWCISDDQFVASTLLRQAQDGSIIIMHMPERGFREHTLAAMSKLLEGLSSRGLRVVTLSELDAIASGSKLTTPTIKVWSP